MNRAAFMPMEDFFFRSLFLLNLINSILLVFFNAFLVSAIIHNILFPRSGFSVTNVHIYGNVYTKNL